MALLQLPSELLFHILSLVGSPFFSQDARRLTVSKRWYQIAWLVTARELDITPQSGLLSLPRFLANEEVFGRVQTHLKSVKLSLEGFDADPRAELVDETNADLEEEWIAQTDRHLEALATKLQRCPQLECLTLIAPLDVYYLEVGPFAKLLSMRHLTVLDVDMGGLCPVNAFPDSETHLCRSINSRLPSLRRLRCRMYRICDTILMPPEDGVSLRLKEVIINLARTQHANGCSVRFPIYICASPPGYPRSTRADIERRATALAARLETPRMVRVIDVVRGDIHAFDAITGRRMVLAPGAEWDADGKTIVES
ncbi:hypothetical protein C8A00DRAFT_32386 [Chaetomidium leptoderma]|uniref:F-box domain-containing protein n=1 Tax=Chaetomidium leptoderma TaxID=669021 RepID=A0AAN6ZZM3_9PEZI|nr:hypothetical protein C8A00DRAFT_32386 [Chaetomidium leptoderma]